MFNNRKQFPFWCLLNVSGRDPIHFPITPTNSASFHFQIIHQWLRLFHMGKQKLKPLLNASKFFIFNFFLVLHLVSFETAETLWNRLNTDSSTHSPFLSIPRKNRMFFTTFSHYFGVFDNWLWQFFAPLALLGYW